MNRKATTFVPGGPGKGTGGNGTGGKVEAASSAAAFSSALAVKLDFFLYLPSSTREDDAAKGSDLIDSTSLMYDRADILHLVDRDLATLLSMDFVRFWSQVLHDDSLFKFLDTYLWYARHEAASDDEEARRSA